MYSIHTMQLIMLDHMLQQLVLGGKLFFARMQGKVCSNLFQMYLVSSDQDRTGLNKAKLILFAE